MIDVRIANTHPPQLLVEVWHDERAIDRPRHASETLGHYAQHRFGTWAEIEAFARRFEYLAKLLFHERRR